MKTKRAVEEEFNRELGFRLMQRRQALHMSQQTLALELDVSAQQIQKYENGKNRLSPEKLHACAQILRVSVGYFYGETEMATPAYNVPILNTAANIEALPDEARRSVNHLVGVINKLWHSRSNDNSPKE